MVRGLGERDLICDQCISICTLILREQGVPNDGIRTLGEWSKALASKKEMKKSDDEEDKLQGPLEGFDVYKSGIS